VRDGLQAQRVRDDHLEPVGELRQALVHCRGEAAGEQRIDLDGHHAAHVRQQGQGEASEARAHLEHDVVGLESRRPHDAAHRVGVGDEVLPPPLGGPDAQLGDESPDVAAAEQRGVGIHHQAPKARWALS
jgi:hypothetical protein